VQLTDQAIGWGKSNHRLLGFGSSVDPLPGEDLRVPHFFATHLMQAVLLVGIFADRLRITSKQILVIGNAICVVTVIVVPFIQATNGYSFAVIYR
jgi:hypothetical protein